MHGKESRMWGCGDLNPNPPVSSFSSQLNAQHSGAKKPGAGSNSQVVPNLKCLRNGLYYIPPNPHLIVF